VVWQKLPEVVHLHLEDLRGILLAERDSGTLVQIPPDLYQTTAMLVKTLQQEVIIMDDPFSDEARILIEKVASIRTTAEELFHLRSEKIVSIAQSQADGSYVDREELRVLIPAELEMFNRIVDGVRACRLALIEWRVGGSRSQPPLARVEIPERLSDLPRASPDEPDLPSGDSSGILTSESALHDTSGVPDSDLKLSGRADEHGEGWTPSDEEDDEPFSYALVRVLADMEQFMGVDGRTYELVTGDILTLPKRNAEVLAERDIVLNINPG
jgi:DNA replication factor GINS